VAPWRDSFAEIHVSAKGGEHQSGIDWLGIACAGNGNLTLPLPERNALVAN
jgi:hypothetical protein